MLNNPQGISFSASIAFVAIHSPVTRCNSFTRFRKWRPYFLMKAVEIFCHEDEDDGGDCDDYGEDYVVRARTRSTITARS